MSKLLFCSFFGFYILVLCRGNELGPGIYSLISVEKCPNENEIEDVKIMVEIEKHKINRTHDGINAKITLSIEINDKYGVYIDICKHVDGGCKDYTILADESLPHFVKKYAENNSKAAFDLAKIDPPDFPIPEGEYEIEDFVIDYCELPQVSPHGKYEALTYLMDGNKKIGCSKVIVEFKDVDENYCDTDE